MITNCRKLLPLGQDDLPSLGPHLVRRRSFLGEPTSDTDTVSIILGFVGFSTLVLDDDRHFGGAMDRKSQGRFNDVNDE